MALILYYMQSDWLWCTKLWIAAKKSHDHLSKKDAVGMSYKKKDVAEKLEFN